MLALTGAGPTAGRMTKTPGQVSGLAVWLDANQIAGKVDGDAVSQWDDMSGNTKHFAQATGSKQPLYKTPVAGTRPVVRFDGVDDVLTNAGVALPATGALFIVYAGNAQADDYGALLTDGGGNRGLFHRGTGGAQARKPDFYYSSSHVFGTAGTNNTFYVRTVVVTSGSTSVYTTNGVLDGSGATGYPSTTITNIGDDSGGDTFKGDIAEIAIYNIAVNATDQRALERGFGVKYGITVA